MKRFMKNLWKDESAQGMLEYMLILVVVVIIGTLFKTEIQKIVQAKLGSIGSSISGFN